MVNTTDQRRKLRRSAGRMDCCIWDTVERGAESADGLFEYTLCPECGRRVFDVHGQPSSLICIRLKCPHCRNIVNIPI